MFQLLFAIYFIMFFFTGIVYFIMFDSKHPDETKVNVITAFICGLIWPYCLYEFFKGDVK